MSAVQSNTPGRGGRFLRWVAILIVVVAAVVLALHVVFDRETILLDQKTRPGPAANYVGLSDGVTHLERAGQAGRPAVVLVHGATVPMWDWDPQFKPLAAAGFLVVRYDQFGRGLSDRPDGAYDRAFYRRQLGDLIAKLKLGRVHLVGHSFGGAVVVDFAAHHPEAVKSLVLIAPMVNSVKRDAGIKLIRLPLIGGFLLRLIGVNSMVKRAGKLLKNLPEARRYQRLFREQFKVKGTERAILAMFRSDAMRDFRAGYARVGRTLLPVLVIWGERDDDIDQKLLEGAVGSLRQKGAAKVEFKVLPGAGHSPNLAVPKKVNALIVEFLKKADGT
ncbi:MAG: alpha/beta hydrolase [Proteobacteria bacterium]|nr:alpha/beta hydrolase [Pseudomonadota bacterium]MBU1741032.1 alpha/beta hydrolase [Pseudomonadota bacterium]